MESKTSAHGGRRSYGDNKPLNAGGLMVARAAALQVNINIDGRPLPTKKRWRTSSKACSPHLLHACAPSSTSPHSDLVQGMAMSTAAVMPFHSLVQTTIFPSPLRSLVSRQCSNRHHHHHAGSGHECHCCHAFPLLRLNAHIPRFPFEL